MGKVRTDIMAVRVLFACVENNGRQIHQEAVRNKSKIYRPQLRVKVYGSEISCEKEPKKKIKKMNRKPCRPAGHRK
jgi:hypothetical protein